MRPVPEASPAPWPTRILRPWLVASAAGLSIGSFLLSFESAPPPVAEAEPIHFAPRAAVADHSPLLQPDPFAPAPSLAAPPEAGATAKPVLAAAVHDEFASP